MVVILLWWWFHYAVGTKADHIGGDNSWRRQFGHLICQLAEAMRWGGCGEVVEAVNVVQLIFILNIKEKNAQLDKL